MRLDEAGECFCAGRCVGEDAQERSHLRGERENRHANYSAREGLAAARVAESAPNLARAVRRALILCLRNR